MATGSLILFGDGGLERVFSREFAAGGELLAEVVEVAGGVVTGGGGPGGPAAAAAGTP